VRYGCEGGEERSRRRDQADTPFHRRKFQT
jgi:hypothetical protein